MLVTAKRAIKALIFGLLYYTGILRLYLGYRLAGGAVVLTYHRVLPQDARHDSFSTEGIVVTPATFRLHMGMIKRLLHPLTPDELARALTAGTPLPPRACLVTFDDGWWDNAAYALPILEEFKVPALVFVATDYIGGNRSFWQEHLARMLFLAWRHGAAASEILRRLDFECSTDLTQQQARTHIRNFVTKLKQQPAAQIEQLVHNVERALRDIAVPGLDSAHADRFMTWSDVERLTAGGIVSIGSHCCSHTPLTKLDPVAVARELAASREILKSRLGSYPADLAYPNGDCNAEIAQLVSAAGYRSAFTTQRGHVKPGDDMRLLARINMHEDATNTKAAFLARLTGII